MKTLILEASGHMRFSWKSEHAISHLLHPLHFEKSLAIHIGSFCVTIQNPSTALKSFVDGYLNLSMTLIISDNFFKLKGHFKQVQGE